MYRAIGFRMVVVVTRCKRESNFPERPCHQKDLPVVIYDWYWLLAVVLFLALTSHCKFRLMPTLIISRPLGCCLVAFIFFFFFNFWLCAFSLSGKGKSQYFAIQRAQCINKPQIFHTWCNFANIHGILRSGYILTYF